MTLERIFRNLSGIKVNNQVVKYIIEMLLYT